MKATRSSTRRGLRCFRALLSVLVGLIATPMATQAQTGVLRGLDAYVNRAIVDWEVPGLGLAIVHGDSVVHMAGYGVTKLGASDVVDANTIFAIGSTSKAFTVMVMAMLVQEGKVLWDDPVTKHLPGFQMFDPYVTHELTLRDLLTHRSGLSRNDYLWYGSSFDRTEIVRRLRLIEPTWSLRSHYGYQNMMFLVAGEVEEQLTGLTWDQLVEQRIFAPLGMKRSTTSIRQLTQLQNVATPHEEIDGKVEPINWRNIDNIAPAGSINSSAADMAQWVRVQLGNGRSGERELIKRSVFREMHQPQMVMPNDTTMERMIPSTHFRAYGLGWILQDYHGRKLVHHNGNIDGMSAQVALMPEEDVGLVILTNTSSSRLPTALMHYIFDRYLDAPYRDWSTDMLLVANDRRKQRDRQRLRDLAARIPDTEPSLSLERYCGEYEHPIVGALRVAAPGDRLVVQWSPAFIGDLEHWNYDTFRVRWRDRSLGTSFLTFQLNARGEIATVHTDGLGQFKRTSGPPECAERG